MGGPCLSDPEGVEGSALAPGPFVSASDPASAKKEKKSVSIGISKGIASWRQLLTSTALSARTETVMRRHFGRTLSASVVLVAAIAACSDEPVPTQAPSFDAASAKRQNPKQPKYLPYGVPVPVGQALTLPPEPYNEKKHGPAHFVGSVAPVDAATLQQLTEERRAMLRTKESLVTGMAAASGGTGERGFFILTGDGVYAGNDTQRNVFLGSGQIIYAPTHLPWAGGSNRACVEAVTIHRNQGAGQEDLHGFWDHCLLNDFIIAEDMNDPAWLNDYVRIYFGEERFYVSVTIVPATGAWVGWLYNYTLGRWVGKVVINSSTSGINGWTIWEYFNLTTCPSIPGIKAADIRIRIGTSWPLLSPSHTSSTDVGPCFEAGGGPYTFDVHQSNYEWHAHTPNNN